ELAAVFGIGATSQVVESLARRVFGGLARGVGGRVLGGAVGTAAGALMSFSTTYALGHAADTYYAKGRTLSQADLRQLFQQFQEDAKTMYPRVEGEIREQAGRLDLQGLMQRVRALT
ncbi:MAG: GTPase, partial [Gemmatimonadales bacterium]